MSNKRNENNERVKRRYLEWRKHARRLSEQSLDKEIGAPESPSPARTGARLQEFHIPAVEALDGGTYVKAHAQPGSPIAARSSPVRHGACP